MAGAERDVSALSRVRCLALRDGALSSGERTVPEECPVALVYDGGTHAVMMATPADIADFALGFSLTERIALSPADITDLDIVAHDAGIEARMWLAPERGAGLATRRRALTGPTGCGLCGIDSIEEAVHTPPRVDATLTVTAGDVAAALAALEPAQHLGRATRAVHAAGFWRRGQGLLALREDVGRHNALDKLAGALARRSDVDPAQGIVVLTSRISVELIQKTAVIGSPVIIAVSAPTALALRVAEDAGITLIGVARRDGFEVFTHPDRFSPEALPHVA